ncbi:MAG: hypothetical protein ACODAQ_04385 [Phycisphaeraceae bacterium]
MRAGWAHRELLVDEPVAMAGYGFRDRRSAGQYMPLRIGAVHIADENESAWLVPLDLAWVSPAMAVEWRDRLQRELGARPEQVLFHPSHTHCGPMLDESAPMKLHPEAVEHRLRERFGETIVAVCQEARDRAADARIELVWGTSDISVNRRGPNRIANFDGMRDPSVGVMILTSARGECVCFCHGCHPTVRGGYLLGPDFPGFARLVLEEPRPDRTAFFLQGFEGDVRPVNLDEDGNWATHHCFIDRVASIGAQLGRDVEAICADQPRTELTGPVGVGMESFELPCVSQLDSPVLRAPETANQQRWAGLLQRMRDAGETPPGSIPLRLHALTIGSTFALLGINGEVCTGYAHRLRETLKDRALLCCALVDDGEAGYIPTEQILAEGGYEAEAHMLRGWIGPYAPGLESTICDRAAQLVDQLTGR